ncbi:amidase signature domain-containing protein [Nemania diffusa]|nr:amidase signature domain-containing protein [Nemania diffusa]
MAIEINLLDIDTAAIQMKLAANEICSPFHGIPIIIKDNIPTNSSLGMPTTYGTAALIDAYGGQNRDVVDLVLKAAIQELGLFKADPSNTGSWPSTGGQGLPLHQSPAGSSSGSAVSVAARFAPIALGTETDGSLVQPAPQAGLYALKPAPGKVSVNSSLGGFLLGIVSYGSWETASFVVEPVESFAAQAIDEAASAISAACATKLSDDMQAEHNMDIEELWDANFKNDFENFMTLHETSPIRSLVDLVQYHKNHADVCLPPEHPSQSVLEEAVTGTPDPGKARERINAVFSDFQLDVILSQCDGRMVNLAATAEYAVTSFPLDFADSNRRA